MAKARRGDTLDLTIDDLAFGGEGVGRVEGYVLFVRGAVPGDRVRVKIVEARSRFGRAVIESLESPSPDRIEPPCPYFGRCGGCRLQHLAYPAQLAFKEKQVRDCLTRIGGVGPLWLPPRLRAGRRGAGPSCRGTARARSFRGERGHERERQEGLRRGGLGGASAARA